MAHSRSCSPMSPIPEFPLSSPTRSVSLPIITVLENDIGTVRVEGYAEPTQSIVQSNISEGSVTTIEDKPAQDRAIHAGVAKDCPAQISSSQVPLTKESADRDTGVHTADLERSSAVQEKNHIPLSPRKRKQSPPPVASDSSTPVQHKKSKIDNVDSHQSPPDSSQQLKADVTDQPSPMTPEKARDPEEAEYEQTLRRRREKRKAVDASPPTDERDNAQSETAREDKHETLVKASDVAVSDLDSIEVIDDSCGTSSASKTGPCKKFCKQVSPDANSDIEIISDSEPVVLRKTKKVKARPAVLFSPAQIERFKRQGSKDDPISLDVPESGR